MESCEKCQGDLRTEAQPPYSHRCLCILAHTTQLFAVTCIIFSTPSFPGQFWFWNVCLAALKWNFLSGERATSWLSNKRSFEDKHQITVPRKNNKRFKGTAVLCCLTRTLLWGLTVCSVRVMAVYRADSNGINTRNCATEVISDSMRAGGGGHGADQASQGCVRTYGPQRVRRGHKNYKTSKVLQRRLKMFLVSQQRRPAEKVQTF